MLGVCRSPFLPGDDVGRRNHGEPLGTEAASRPSSAPGGASPLRPAEPPRFGRFPESSPGATAVPRIESRGGWEEGLSLAERS